MKTIWKFPLAVLEEVQIDMPRGAEALTVQLQAGNPTLWALVDPSAPIVERTFLMLGTGWQREDSQMTGLHYIGSVQVDYFVWRYFERPEVAA